MKEKDTLITKIPSPLKDLRPLGDTVLHLNIKYVMQNLLVLTDSASVLCPGPLPKMPDSHAGGPREKNLLPPSVRAPGGPEHILGKTWR